jgi:hypothetical protein
VTQAYVLLPGERTLRRATPASRTWRSDRIILEKR